MHQHWSEWLADRVIEEKKEPYVISGGMTTSGPVHFGTLCELLFPSAIKKALEKRGKKCKYYFVADIFDAFDSVPKSMEEFTAELEPHLGKPLCDVPDPTGKSKSFGDHYLDEAKDLMKKFGIDAEVIRINEYYEKGKFDEYARFYLANEAEARKIVEDTSGKTEKKDWSPLMPVCQSCGKIATTRVLSHDEDEYEYACDKDVKYVKGCGFKGKNSISDHKYKIVWRLHWPAWKQIFGSSIEGAGVDHHTKGGSEDTCEAITKQLMKKDYHIPYKYGFILFQGKKYSKSKGTGMGISEISTLLMPEVIKYMLLKPDLEENIDIDPQSEKILRKIEEFEGASRLKLDEPEISRSDRKKAIAYGLSTDNANWKASFLDVLLYFQLYQSWEKVGELTKDPEGVAYLKPYIEEWIKRGFMPEDYKFRYEPKEPSANARKFFESLENEMDALAVHNAVFEFAKANGMEPKALFADIYQALIGKPRGPRLGKLIAALSVDKVKKDLRI
ncbi:lysine--tRNA ligase [Candidatus Micrarchaeota archaeon]|nr:lysine--tRNA ligase [Candidatus Micrarchaeota archaeon]MBU1681495.1 lysine--tRNA ligase [Candidatus Micrarchaeota archaeon]